MSALSSDVIRSSMPLWGAWLFLLDLAAAQPVPPAPDGMEASACPGTACPGLSFLAPPTQPLFAESAIAFDIAAQDEISLAFANQVIDLVSANLSDQARVAPAGLRLDPLASLNPPRIEMELQVTLGETTLTLDLAAASSPSLTDEAATQDEAQQSDALTFNAAGADAIGEAEVDVHEGLSVTGMIRQQDEEVVELTLHIGTETERQTLNLRADLSDWRQVAHYVSETLAQGTEGAAPGLYDSQLLVISERQLSQMTERRLARIDQGGGGLTWIELAGDQVSYATFLDTRFDLAFIDQSNGQNRLTYHNLLTGRTLPIAVLPDLIGQPSVSGGGRLIAFSGSEQDALIPEGPTDIYLVDVGAGSLAPISIPGSQDLYPSFSNASQAVAFVTSRPNWSELLVVSRPDGGNILAWSEAEIVTLYSGLHPLSEPVWSPDGLALAFIEHDPTVELDLLQVIDLDTAQLETVAMGQRLTNPTWGPAPDLLAVLVQGEDQDRAHVVRVNRALGTARVLPTPHNPIGLAWSPAGWRPQP